MEKDLKELRECLLLSPDYTEVNDSLANFSTKDMTDGEIAECLGIAPDWMDTIDTSQLT
ncbi:MULTISPECIES: hypothetical protein [Citrobacter]|uniref:hypothetical protein n=1 Tax=Citrobacter TaxID=544 RepID=UPI000657D39D|nr:MULTISPECIES: hypothetical protein [Citrobacter]KLV79033.1 hypothetical protein SK39_03747 [Citrobacter sp. BIDMC107]MBJ9176338.1 hypothetical protein [Citrobacter freundii]MCT4723072.1 hypothetical protein [Citrobacter freundii]MCT4750115.1 hypothetical protein [Citrobacter freundii]MCX3145024.1 hypothetical protein [Citrobacter freundii]